VILSEFEWKAIESLYHDKTPVASPINSSEEPQLLGQLTLEITLTKRPPQYVGFQLPFGSPIANEGSLKDDVFQPKLFTVRIEQGNFIIPVRIGKRQSELARANGPNRFFDLRSAIRIVFDPSPYPPANGWKDPGRTYHYCEREFTGQFVKKLQGKGRAMNDVQLRDV
jgi:hypothetical protein